MVAVAATGTDNIDLQASRELGAVVSDIRNYAVHPVAEHTFAVISALRRSICVSRYRHRGALARGQAVLLFSIARFAISQVRPSASSAMAYWVRRSLR